MFLINLNAETVACKLSFRKSHHKANLENTSKFGFPQIWGENGGVLSMHMQVILDSSFARPGSGPIRGGKKGSSGTGLSHVAFILAIATFIDITNNQEKLGHII